MFFIPPATSDLPALATPFCTLKSCPGASVGLAGQLFADLVMQIAAAQCVLAPPDKYPPNCATQLRDKEVFDFIIIGGGTAGSVLAGRLAENKDWNILLLEAGSYPSATTEIPAIFYGSRRTKEDWMMSYKANDKACQGMNNCECDAYRPKVLGGKSSVDLMQYMRGTTCDYDSWDKFGIKNWNYSCVLPYFKKTENVKYENFKNSELHGIDGCMVTDYIDSKEPIKAKILEIATALGHKVVDDEAPLGFFEVLNNICEGSRQSAAEAFLADKKFPNLKIATGVLVYKVVFDQKKNAVGVQLRIGKNLILVRAKNEVILAAGALKNPQVLMLSGVGPYNHLDELKIKPVTSSDVGLNLMEQLGVPLFFKLQKGVLLEQKSGIKAMFKYLMKQKGPLATIGISNLIGKVNVVIPSTGKKGDKHDHDFEDANIKIMFYSIPCNRPDVILGIFGTFNYNKELLSDLLSANKEFDLLVVYPILINPKSVGSVKLRSRSPFDAPIADGNFLCDDRGADLATLLGSIRIVEAIFSHALLADCIVDQVRFALPECDAFEYKSDDYYKCVIKFTAFPFLGASGTTRMGGKKDKHRVVDEDLKVCGVQNLRVVGTSVLPRMVSGSMITVAIMIAEKASDMIKKAWTTTGDKVAHDDTVLSDDFLNELDFIPENGVDLYYEQAKENTENYDMPESEDNNGLFGRGALAGFLSKGFGAVNNLVDSVVDKVGSVAGQVVETVDVDDAPSLSTRIGMGLAQGRLLAND